MFRSADETRRDSLIPAGLNRRDEGFQKILDQRI